MKPGVKVIIYDSAEARVEVRLEGETVWLSQAQMAELFGTSSDNISLHLKNIYKEQELLEAATTEDFSVFRQEGKRRCCASSNTTTSMPSFPWDIASVSRKLHAFASGPPRCCASI